MLRIMNCFYLILILCVTLLGQNTVQETPAWNVTLKANTRAPSNITVQNRCKKKHRFEIRPENVPFLNVSETEISVKGGKNKVVPVMFDTTNIDPGVHKGRVLVICKSCPEEPTCTQDREILPVILTVPGAAVLPAKADNATGIASKPKDPCAELKKKCDELLRIANAKQAVADSKRAEASKAQGAADKLEKAAKDAEAAAKKAENLATIKPPSGRGRVDGGREYTTADSAYLAKMNAQVVADYNAGKITVEEHQRRLKANTIEKARKERIKHEAKLKKEAKEARATADKARKAADEANAKAKKSKADADAAQREADKARKAYEECIEKVEEECEKLKKRQEEARKKAEAARIRAEAEIKRKEAEAARLAAAEADRKVAEERRLAAEKKSREARQARIERQKRIQRVLYRQMYRLGFISGSEIDENRTVLGFLPRFAQDSVSETIADAWIPEDSLEVIAEMELVRNPCGSNTVKERAWLKLESMVNPRTDNKYTDAEAQKTLREMCRMLRHLGKRQDELKKYLDNQ